MRSSLITHIIVEDLRNDSFDQEISFQASFLFNIVS